MDSIEDQDADISDEEGPVQEGNGIDEHYEYGPQSEPFSERDVKDSSMRRHARRVNNITAEKAVFDVSYHPRRVLLYAPPRQRRKWGDSDTLPRINWG